MANLADQNKSAYAERQKFIDEVHRFEAEAKADPKRYESRCRSLVKLGYGYLIFIIALLLTIIGGIIWLMVTSSSVHTGLIKLALIVGLPVLAIIASLFRRHPDVRDGIDVTRAQAPKLWAEVDKLQQSLKAPKIHVIRITADWNASANQIPLFGMFGPCKNTLRYGLPLLAAESADETRATIAHELGHFAGDHSRFSGVVYRIFDTWQVAGEHLGGFSSFLLKPFLNWYLPKLWATTFPLRRQAEYFADEAATRLVGARPNALNLVRLGTQSDRVMDTMRGIFDLVEAEARPPENYITQLVHTAKSGLTPEEFDASLATAMKQETDYADSHPSISDRLAAIDKSIQPQDFKEQICRPTSPSAMDDFLGNGVANDLERALNQYWAASVSQGWAHRHQQVAAGAADLREAENQDLTAQSLPTLSRHLTTSLQVRGPEGSEKIARAVLEKDATHPEANFVVGAALAEKDPAAAREHLETASRNPALREAAYYALSQLAEREGKTNEAAKFFDLANREEDSAAAYMQEIVTFNQTAGLRTWTLDETQRMALIAALDGTTKIKAVYSVNFPSDARPDMPHEVLVVVPKTNTFVASEETLINRVAEEIQNLSFAWRILAGTDKRLRKAVEDLAGAKVWEAPN